MKYQVVQLNIKEEDVVFHDEMEYSEALQLKQNLLRMEIIRPIGWQYYLEPVE